jgi:NAD(P)-dependent dehydrogenase (short-subunit alcohol dehydrogenase family)
MSPAPGRRVAIIAGASRGIGESLVAAYRCSGYSVVATSRTISSSDEHDYQTVQGDIAQAETARRAVDRFGRIDTLIQ